MRIGGVLMALGFTAILLAHGASAQTQPADNAELVVVAAQTELRFPASAEEFAEHMRSRVEAAMVYRPDLIVFPEDIAMPLIALGDYDLVTGAGSPEEAIGGLLTRHSAAVGALVAEHEVSPQRALWLAKAEVISATYRETFSALSREHEVYIAAGSVPMVPPDRPGAVLNTACVFDPAGEMQIVGTKVHLVPLEGEEGLDFSPGSAEDYRIVRTPKATFGTIICADGWDPAIAAALVEQGAEVLVQVSANPERWSEGTREGWRDSLFSRVQELGVYGVCVMGVGNLLGVPMQGQSAIVAPCDWTPDGSGFIAEAASATGEEIIAATLDLSRLRGK